MNIPEFQYNYLLVTLLLLPVGILIFLRALRKKKQAVKKIGDASLVKELMAGYSSKKYLLKFLLALTALGFMVLSLANMRTSAGTPSGKRNGVDVMIALDVSKSMLAADVKPNRLERARQLINRLIDHLPGDRLGIVLFAGKAYLQMPLTADHSAAKMYLSTASPDIIPTQGTVIAEALKMSNGAFNRNEKKYKTILLISDGEDHDEAALTIAKEVASAGVIIHTVGIGSQQGSTIIDPLTGQVKTDINGNAIISKLNENELRQLAKSGNGLYQYFDNTDKVVDRIVDQISHMEQKAVKDDSLTDWHNFFQYFAGAAFLLLLIEVLVSEKKRRSTGGSRNKLVTALSLILFMGYSAKAQSENEWIKQGNTAYQKGNYSGAAEKYREAIKKNPQSGIAYYNLANAQYKSRKINESIVSYDKASKLLTKAAELSDVWYNKGVVLQNDKKNEECILAYKNALLLNPGHEQARQNLQKALKKQQEKKDKQNQQDQNKNPQPKPQSSKLTQKDAEEKLKALMQQEQNLQDKLNKQNAQSPNQPEKDW
ncbi:MAG TPA: VWA domain-containing protein [Ferruginibacter sp.]|nr:VWA domain-containing protein [Bacteroidota bacterium]HMT95125.1 VWA domain-containing protein [Ferruginibacter sp.]HMU25389.1 VWA domain-containing protein [Ferruginibacter sp.]